MNPKAAKVALRHSLSGHPQSNPLEAEQLPLATFISVTYMDVAKGGHAIVHPSKV